MFGTWKNIRKCRIFQRWLLNFERYVHVYLSFRCIFLICSCHLSNHPSILWTILYPSPDDGYYNRNVNVDFTSWYIHLFGLYFFLLPSYCRILSIFTFILSFRKKLIPNICICAYIQRIGETSIHIFEQIETERCVYKLFLNYKIDVSIKKDSSSSTLFFVISFQIVTFWTVYIVITIIMVIKVHERKHPTTFGSSTVFKNSEHIVRIRYDKQ